MFRDILIQILYIMVSMLLIKLVLEDKIAININNDENVPVRSVVYYSEDHFLQHKPERRNICRISANL